MTDGDDRRTPTAEAMATHLRRHAPRPGSRSVSPAVLIAGAAVIAAVLVTPVGGSAWLPWVVMAAMAGWIIYRGRSAAMLQRQTAAVYELALLRRYAEAMRQAWDLLPRLANAPQQHAQIASLVASCLLRLRAYDAAIVVCDHLLTYVPPGSGASNYLRLQRLIALLGADRLTDAADELSKLRNATLGPIETAMFTLATLHQQIKTNHHADAAEAADDAAARLRPLGTEAGYGYALIAAAMASSDRTDDAAAWWRKATMLVTPSAIAWELPELAADPAGGSRVLSMTPAPTITEAATLDPGAPHA